ncbi:Esterase/lipase-like protein [Chthoniobacter flavus Ellin428]|uniref:Esterase/lipase-like protein n=1 Tax=Chthoniobacter flavus Ellin428 TaxID=497964 RepID=B4D8V5_9BACT|nr:Esterase/lipase-like protein [Chthoniobacter flavus Ellin428]
MVAANYRLSPKATYPAYLDDSAAAVAWVVAHAAEQHFDPSRIFVSGHSAGGYLAYMIGLDDRWLKPYGLKPSAIAGLIPISGQTMTHYTVREERGITDHNVISADEAAPINHLHKDTPPMLILYADRDMAARREENRYLAAVLRATGDTHVQELQINDRTHGSIAGDIAHPGDPAAEAILHFIADPSSRDDCVEELGRAYAFFSTIPHRTNGPSPLMCGVNRRRISAVSAAHRSRGKIVNPANRYSAPAPCPSDSTTCSGRRPFRIRERHRRSLPRQRHRNRRVPPA